MSEHQLQCAFFIWSKLQASKYPDLLKMFAIPNGGARHIAVASKLKAEGVKAGMPDVFLPVARNGFIGFWIEFKVRPNKCTPEQLGRISQLRHDGHCVVVCYGLDEAIEAVMRYLKGYGF